MRAESRSRPSPGPPPFQGGVGGGPGVLGAIAAAFGDTPLDPPLARGEGIEEMS